MKRLDNRKKVILVGALFQLATLSVLSTALLLLLTNINHAKTSQFWPHTRGVVTAGDESQQVGGQSSVGTIWYQYEIDGRTYRSSRVSFFEANELYKHPEGEAVKVFYNPKDCQDACLVKGVSAEAMWKLYYYLAVFVGSIVAIFCMFLTVFFGSTDEKAGTSLTEKIAIGVIARSLMPFW